MTMIDTAALPPMPDLACPAWCSAAHYSAWRQHVEASRWVEQADPSRRIDPALLFESSHRTELPTDVDPGHGCESLDLEIVQHPGSAPELTLIAELGLTAEQARVLAGALLAGADRLEEIQPPRKRPRTAAPPTSPPRLGAFGCLRRSCEECAPGSGNGKIDNSLCAPRSAIPACRVFDNGTGKAVVHPGNA